MRCPIKSGGQKGKYSNSVKCLLGIKHHGRAEDMKLNKPQFFSQELGRPVGGERGRCQLGPTQASGTELVRSVQAFLWAPRRFSSQPCLGGHRDLVGLFWRDLHAKRLKIMC